MGVELSAVVGDAISCAGGSAVVAVGELAGGGFTAFPNGITLPTLRDPNPAPSRGATDAVAPLATVAGGAKDAGGADAGGTDARDAGGGMKAAAEAAADPAGGGAAAAAI